MTLKQFPAAERPRERLLAHGPLPLTDAELLAIFLRTGTGGRDALALARELLARTGGLRHLVDLPLVDFLTLPVLDATQITGASNRAVYFIQPTPGQPNAIGAAQLGPVLTAVANSPAVPTDTQDLFVTARASAALSPVASVSLMAAPEGTLPLTT